LLYFPGADTHDELEALPEVDPNTMIVDDGALALDGIHFHIDEEDPLILTTGRHEDVVPSPERRADMRLIEGPALSTQGRQRIRLKDLHPLDCLIVLSILVLAFVL